MRLGSKLTISFFLTSLLTALLVAESANWMILRDFRHAALTDAFNHFRADVTAYLEQYGSWQAGAAQERFPHFVARRHPEMAERTPDAGRGPVDMIAHRVRAPFRFMLVDSQHRVVLPNAGYRPGDMVPLNLVRSAQPILVQGRIELLAIPIDVPNLSAQDMEYLSAIRHALLIGIAIAGSIAALIGLIVGQRMSAKLRALTRAIQTMQLNTKQRAVDVQSNDEIGVLAAAFNKMSADLGEAHEELHRSSQMVQAQAEQLRELSVRDPLTGLYNRRHFDAQTDMLHKQAVRHQQPLSLMVADVDHFKWINDNCSHAVGDAVLRQVATILQHNTRDTDVLARYGGEEFVLAMVHSTHAQAFERCEAIRQQLASHPWSELHPRLTVTISMGISDNTAAGSFERMLSEADAHLYAAKHAGRNRVHPPPAVRLVASNDA